MDFWWSIGVVAVVEVFLVFCYGLIFLSRCLWLFCPVWTAGACIRVCYWSAMAVGGGCGYVVLLFLGGLQVLVWCCCACIIVFLLVLVSFGWIRTLGFFLLSVILGVVLRFKALSLYSFSSLQHLALTLPNKICRFIKNICWVLQGWLGLGQTLGSRKCNYRAK